MKKQKFLSSLLVVAVIFSGLSFPASAAVNTDTLTYLQNQDQSNAWVLMARKAAGQSISASQLPMTGLTSPTEIERTILALAAAGEDASTYKGQNLIQKLDATRTNNQIGNSALLNDDFWGILAYKAAGVANTDNRIVESKNFVLNNQNSDGGWSHSTVSSSDSNDTAMAVTALVKAGVSSGDSRIQSAITYLKTTQNDDGGFAIAPNAESDSASTAWVISALHAANQTPASWVKNSKTPFMYLQTVKHTDGSYKWKPQDGQGNPVMTSYVAIALAGKSYPVAIKNASSNTDTGNGNDNENNSGDSNSGDSSNNNSSSTDTTTIKFRIEGSSKQICSGTLAVKDPLHLVEAAASQCGYSYLIENSSFGRYLKRINTDTATGNSGWLYLVNWKQPSVGAADYDLQANDYITWYFGEFDWEPLKSRVINISTAQKQGNPIVEVQYLENNSTWRDLSGATVYFGTKTATTNSGGEASFSVNNGTYDFYAIKNNYVRSATESITINKSGTSVVSKSIPLKTTIQAIPQNPISPPPPSPAPPAISFDIDVISSGSDIVDFGSLKPGQVASRSLELKNTGNVNLTFSASVTGDKVFQDYLQLDSNNWKNYSRTLSSNQKANVDVRLTLPSALNESGNRSGNLIIWARP
jgi:hypothetical protein